VNDLFAPAEQMVERLLPLIAGLPAAVNIHQRVGSGQLASGTWRETCIALAVICVIGLQVRSFGAVYSWLKAYWSLGLAPRPEGATAELGSAKLPHAPAELVRGEEVAAPNTRCRACPPRNRG
jgi:hypothetical protein